MKLYQRADTVFWIPRLFFLVLFSCSTQVAQYAPFTQRFLHELEKAQKLQQEEAEEGELILPQKTIDRFLVKSGDRGYVVHGMIKVNKHFRARGLQRLNIFVKSRGGELWGVIIPVQSLKPLGLVKGIIRIEIDSPVKKRKT